MPRMRHPNGAGPYEATDEQVSHMRMGGWLTDEEWTAAGLPEPPEPEPDDDEPGAGEAAEGEEQDDKPSRRARPRATSKKGND